MDGIIHPVTVCCYEVPHHVCCVKEGWGNYHVARLKPFLPYHLLTLVSLEVSNAEGTNISRGNIFRALEWNSSVEAILPGLGEHYQKVGKLCFS